ESAGVSRKLPTSSCSRSNSVILCRRGWSPAQNASRKAARSARESFSRALRKSSRSRPSGQVFDSTAINQDDYTIHARTACKVRNKVIKIMQSANWVDCGLQLSLALGLGSAGFVSILAEIGSFAVWHGSRFIL